MLPEPSLLIRTCLQARAHVRTSAVQGYLAKNSPSASRVHTIHKADFGLLGIYTNVRPVKSGRFRNVIKHRPLDQSIPHCTTRTRPIFTGRTVSGRWWVDIYECLYVANDDIAASEFCLGVRRLPRSRPDTTLGPIPGSMCPHRLELPVNFFTSPGKPVLRPRSRGKVLLTVQMSSL